MTAPDLSALESLLAKATPGPYYWFMRECADKDALMVELTAVVEKTVAVNGYNLHGVGVGEPEPDADYLAVAHTGCGPRSPINAQLIVAAVNALPSLLAYVRELERERDEALGHAEIWHALSEVRSRESGSGYTHGAVEGALDAARRAAALAMRERCAQRAESAQANGSDCAAAIRALEP